SFLDGDLQSAMKNVKAAIDRAGMDAFTQRYFSEAATPNSECGLSRVLKVWMLASMKNCFWTWSAGMQRNSGMR
ncbi:MAG TPA: hypothetical protein VGU64_15380, partial [Terriglobales bacterium]|nr:hypothetical protein [Terriglobales bacterium]